MVMESEGMTLESPLEIDSLKDYPHKESFKPSLIDKSEKMDMDFDSASVQLDPK